MSSVSYSCVALGNQVDYEVSSLSYTGNFTMEEILRSCCSKIRQESNYSKPMVWIGVYIAVASLFCVLAMMADLLHGFRNRKFWFPCKYFTLNATSITIITIAMKLPVDLNTPMVGTTDIIAKLGSLLFMSTMMTNLMPSLASMNNKELLANGTGLVILVITLIVNTSIQVKTGLLYIYYPLVCLYSGTVLCSLMILVSTAIATPKVKQILEFKYQVAHKLASNDKYSQHTKFNVEELMKHVRRYWVMSRTSNPQFVMASTPLCCAASVISVFVAAFHLIMVSITFRDGYYTDYASDYKWSMILIVTTQCIGILAGNIAPLFRCFAALGFKLSFKWTLNHLRVFEVEKYWTEKLSAWKESHIAIPSNHRILKALVHILKTHILSLWIGFQIIIVVSCKVIGLIPIVVILVMYSLYSVKSLKAMFSSMVIETRHNTVHEHDQNDTVKDISNYVLQLQDEGKLAKWTVKRISNSLNLLMQKAAKKQMPNNLMQLLQKSTGFEGVVSFDSDQVQPLPSVELINCWCMPVVTLTCIAIALPNIRKDIIDCLMNSVDEGLSYARLVEENLNISRESVNIQKLINNLWYEVDVKRRWLGNTLKGNAYKGKTSKEILKFFNNKAKEVVLEIQNNMNEGAVENSRHKLIAANSMYRITQTIMLKNQCIIEQNSGDQLFDMLSAMIADILAACLTNLPQVIVMKCHESVIEKREASVEAAAELLGRAKEIINKIQMYELPSIDPNRMISIDEWGTYLKALPKGVVSVHIVAM